VSHAARIRAVLGGVFRNPELRRVELAFAADAGHRQPNLLRRKGQDSSQLVAIDVQPLRGKVEINSAVAIGYGQTRLGSERCLVLHSDLVLPLHDHVGAGALVAVPDLDVAGDVSVRVQTWCGLGQGELRVGERLEHLVLDANFLGSAPGKLRRFGCDQCHSLAPIAHHVDGKDRLVLDLEPVHLVARHILVSEDGVHPWRGESFSRVDAQDACIRVRAAHRRRPEHAIDRQV